MLPDPGTAAPPRPVRAAGGLVAVQGAAGLVAAAVLAAGGRGALPLGTAAYFAAIGAALVAVGVALVRGRYGARTPAVVAQLLLLGVAWYAGGPSGRPEYGVPAALFCVVVLGLLFSPSATAWVTGRDEHP